MKKAIFPFLILLTFLFGCSDNTEETPAQHPEQSQETPHQPESITPEKAKNLSIQDYFPKEPGTIREYEILNETGEVWIKDYEVINSFGSTEFLSPEELGKFVILRSSEIYKPDLSVKESSDSYELENNKLIRLASEDSEDSKAENEVLLANEVSWEMKEGITRTITATGTTIRTEAGEFTNCIETIDTSDENQQYQLKSYFAPEAGLVLEEKLEEESDSYMTVKELINIQYPKQQAQPGNGEANPEAPEQNSSSPITDTPAGSFVYHNEEYDFYLDLPMSWRGYYLVEETGTEGDKTINFRFKSGDNLYIDTIVYIVVTDKSKEQIEQENAESGFPMTYVASNNGKSFAYLYNVGDPSNELINAEEDLAILMELKQQVPTVMETLRFEP